MLVDYFFERIQRIRVCVFDIDKSNTKDLSKQDFIGEATCKISDIVTMQGNKVTLRLLSAKLPGSNRGTITISAEEVQIMSHEVHFRFRGHGLDKKDFFGKSDPFIIISRYRDDGTLTPVLKTPHITNTLNPYWAPIKAPAQKICNGDLTRQLLVECFDYNKSGNHSFIGSFTTTLEELLANKGNSFPLINNKKKKKKSYKNSGTLEIVECKLEKVYSFLDFVRGGCEMKLLVGIDFTASNGNPRQPGSLHYFADPSKPNDYLRAIRSVGDILCAYDSTKQLPTFGFGAKVGGRVSHCFYLNGHPNNPEVNGIDGVLAAYHQCIPNIQFFGPTNFADVIKFSTKIARDRSGDGECLSYCILLILTDGVISDLQQTINAIVDASNHPLSIVIVGIGNADFDNMDVLDADDNPLISSSGVKMKRDIVQFVPFNQFKSDMNMLAKEVLEELPGQVVDFFKMKNIAPNPSSNGIHHTFVQEEVVSNEPIPTQMGFSNVAPLQGFGNQYGMVSQPLNQMGGIVHGQGHYHTGYGP